MTPKSGAQKSASSRTAPPKAGDKPPSWPKLQPLVPSSDLSLFTLVPDQILLIHNFWTSTLCSTLVKFASSNVELQTTPSQRKRGDALRINDRYQVKDQSLANRLWENTALRELVLGVGGEEDRRKLWGGEPVGVNPNIRVYRYRKGQFFGPHCE
ncbi:MAG: hypothetical protein M1838_004957 [Thelocarpon superellum]|nr:MAG: hypothetical protein M1838_004957 [Thelocarpon superellum]